MHGIKLYRVLYTNIIIFIIFIIIIIYLFI